MKVVLNWFSQSIKRQISTLLVTMVFLSLFLVFQYFYQVHNLEIKQATTQLARQLIATLVGSTGQFLQSRDSSSAQDNIENQFGLNQRQKLQERYFLIEEIAILDLDGNTFAHSNPRSNPLKNKYGGMLPSNLVQTGGRKKKSLHWSKSNGRVIARFYETVTYQERVVGMAILEVRFTKLYAELGSLLSRFFWAMAALMVFALVVGLVFGKWVSAPLDIIKSSLVNRNVVKLYYPKSFSGRDEFSALSEAVEKLNIDLSESNFTNKLLLESTSEAIYGVDTQGCCTFANTSCVDLLGYQNASELIDQNMHSLIHHSYSDGTAYSSNDCPICLTFENEQESHVSNEVLWRQDGTCFTAEYRSSPIFEQDECVGAVFTFVDISMHKAAEQKIRENERNLAITLNSIGDAVIATDSEGNVLRMNPVAERLTGWAVNDAIGEPVKKVFSIIDSDSKQEIENPVDNVIKNGEVVYLSHNTTLISRSGVEYQISDSAAPIYDSGDIVGMVLVFNDITEQYRLRELAVKSRRDLQAIMDHTPAVISIKDLSGSYLFVNRQFEKLTQLEGSFITGRTDDGLFSEKRAAEMCRNDKFVSESGRAMESEISFLKDDITHQYLTTKFPLLDEEKSIYAICSISTDNTERIFQEQRIRSSQRMEALGKLTGGIAHDYNNILGVVLGYAEQAYIHRNDPEKIARYSHSIKHAAQRGSELAKKLLSFSRHDAPDKSVISINSVLQEQQHMLRKTLTAQINLSFSLEKDLWPVQLSSNNLEDAILNICINALHAMQSGGDLTISTHNETLQKVDVKLIGIPEGDYVLLMIADTGTGMDPDIKEKIFEPFYSTKGELGTGLGLSQVYGFVERNGGTVKVYSELGQGSTFILYFPRSDKVITESKIDTIADSASWRGEERLLVVDDELAIAELAYDIFTEHGYQVYIAGNGKEALSILEEQQIDLVVSDVIMPQMDGYQLAAEIRLKYPFIKIQMVSGFGDDRHKGKVDQALHDNLLYKPYSSEKLLAKVRGLLDENKAVDLLRHRTILVMDDDEDIQELYKINLRKLGCNVICVSNGEDAIKRYQSALTSSKPVDIMIVDSNIPGGMGGKEVSAKVRELHPSAKIIVCSGNTSGPEMIKPLDYGFDGALEKDFNLLNIRHILESLVAP